MTCDMQYKIIFTHDLWPAFFRQVKCPMGWASIHVKCGAEQGSNAQGGGGGEWSRLVLTDTLAGWPRDPYSFFIKVVSWAGKSDDTLVARVKFGLPYVICQGLVSLNWSLAKWRAALHKHIVLGNSFACRKWTRGDQNSGTYYCTWKYCGWVKLSSSKGQLLELF